jgi:GT2 family glycosyltransferase
MALVMDLSIIIINWNSADYLNNCLRSLYDNVKGPEFEIIVVDNASFDGSEAMLRSHYPQATFIQSDANLGFSKANNLGAKQARGRVFLFLNPDTEVTGSAIQDMMSTFDARPDAGIVGCKLLNGDGTIQTSCIAAFPTILSEALDLEYLQVLFPESRLWGMAALATQSSDPQQVECVSGACLMIRRDVFESVGGFSANYFMYAEDRDLCYKVHQAAYRAYFVGSATIVHFGGRSSESQTESNFSAVMRCQSLLEFMRCRHGWAYAAAYRGTTAVAAFFRLMILGSIYATLPGWRTRWHPALNKWVGIFRWSLGRETCASRYGAEHAASSGVRVVS